MRKPPPKKQKGIPTGPRKINGHIMDVSSVAITFFGGSKKMVESRVARRCLPFKRFGGRIIFIRKELEEFFGNLDGCRLSEAKNNEKMRRGEVDALIDHGRGTNPAKGGT